MYLTKLTDQNIKVYKMEHERLKVSGISFDSRKIKQGMLFALIKENNQYISDAIKFGAKAVLCKITDINNAKQNVINIININFKSHLFIPFFYTPNFSVFNCS